MPALTHRVAVMIALGVCAFARTAGADEADSVPRGRHRIGAAVGLGATFASADEDGHWREGSGAPGFLLDYAYGVTRIFDLGAALRYWNLGAFSNGPASDYNQGENGIHHAILPGLSVRLHTTTAPVEVGATLGAGALVLVQNRVPDAVDSTRVRAHTWTGWHGSLAIDVRFWVAKHWALQIAPTAVFGIGTDSGSEVGYYLRREAVFANLEGCFGAVFAP
jgi:hypothetical protein